MRKLAAAALAAASFFFAASAEAAPTSAPANVKSTSDQTSITVSWDAVPDAASYRARLWPGGTSVTTKSPTTTTAKFGSLSCGKTYAISVAGYNGGVGPVTVDTAKTADCVVTPPPPPPPPDPGTGGTGTDPAPIAGQGYHLAFADEFNSLDRSTWDDHIWYDGSPNPTWSNAYGGFQFVSNGILHLHTSRNFVGSSGSPYPLNTVTTQTSGKTWTQGYFEARMKWTGGHGAWPGFWLYSYRHATNPNYPSVNSYCSSHGLPVAQCYSGELDAFEGQGSDPSGFYGTIHRNSCGCYGAGDQQNGNNYDAAGVDLTQGFHDYGMLWTSTQISWYLDGKLMHSAPVYDSTNQPMFLLLQMWTGGWTYDPDSTTPNDLDTQVDYVHVYQK